MGKVQAGRERVTVQTWRKKRHQQFEIVSV
jgi:hypothetical protein